MASAMILAAGFGTRLRPLTDELPKPLVPVGDAPLVAHIERHLASAGVDRVVINTHHEGDAWLDALPRLPLPTVRLHEARILGTAGGVRNALPALDDGPLLIWNGDILGAVDVGRLFAALVAQEALAAWSIAPRPRGQGTVGIDAAGRVCRVRQVRVADEASGGDFLGISVLSPRARALLPSEGCLVGDVLGPAIERGERVAAVLHDGAWHDVGTPAAYLAACLDWLARTGASSHRRPDATVAPAVTLDRAIVGDGARIDGEGIASRVVVWPRARASAPIEGAIITPRSLVRVAS